MGHGSSQYSAFIILFVYIRYFKASYQMVKSTCIHYFIIWQWVTIIIFLILYLVIFAFSNIKANRQFFTSFKKFQVTFISFFMLFSIFMIIFIYFYIYKYFYRTKHWYEITESSHILPLWPRFSYYLNFVLALYFCYDQLSNIDTNINWS